MSIRTLCAFGFSCVLLGCGQSAESSPDPAASPSSGAPESSSPSPASVADGPLVVFLGDSLTAGYGLDSEQAFPALIAAQLREEGVSLRVVNAGVSGDTTAGGLARLDWLLRQEPDILVVGLGANDGLRGLELSSSEDNLRKIIRRAQAAGAQVLLAGMLIPPNYGADYVEGFAALYPRLASELEVPLIPFLLAGVAAQPELNLADGIHPNTEGQKRVAATVIEHLRPLLEALPEA